jgi:hypothetical protein
MKPSAKAGLEFGDLAKLSNRNVELVLFVGRNSSLHVLAGVGRESPQGERQA